MDRIDVKDGPCCVIGEVNDERRRIPVGLLDVCCLSGKPGSAMRQINQQLLRLHYLNAQVKPVSG